MENKFSRLVIVPRNYSLEDFKEKLDELVELYFNGTKVCIVTFEKEVVNSILDKLNKSMYLNKVYYEAGDVFIDFFNKDIKVEHREWNVNIFNFEVILVKHSLNGYMQMDLLEIINGDIDNNKSSKYDIIKYLKYLDNNSKFNMNSFLLEHHNENEDILVEASAGTGKTFSIINRIIYLMYRNKFDIDFIKNNLLLITFTNKATDEMKNRLSRALDNYYKLTKNKKYLLAANEIVNMKISTIHGFSIDMIRDNSEKLGISNNFEITSGNYEFKKILNNVIENRIGNEIIDILGKNGMKISVFKDSIFNFYKLLIGKNIDVLNIDNNWGLIYGRDNNILMEFVIASIKEAKSEYNKINLSENKVHLSDINISLRNLSSYINTGDINFTNEYKYIFIDEFQDTDDIQIDIIAKLKERYEFNLFIVGDVKQALYRFRGADVTSFTTIKKYCSSKFYEYDLIKNYRTGALLIRKLDKVFNKLNRKGFLEYDSNKCISMGGAGTYIGVEGKREEKGIDVSKVIDVIKGFSDKELEEKSIAILFRNNKEIKEVIDECKRNGITNIRSNDIGDLYNNIEAVELFKLLNALIFRKDLGVLLEFINTGYINESVNRSILSGKNKEDKYLMLEEILNIKIFNTMGLTWIELCEEIRLGNNGELLIDIIYNLKPWGNSKNILEYKKNIQKILDLYLAKNNIEYWNIVKFKDDLSISIFTRKEEERAYIGNNKNYIVCSTIHKAKGLEYDYVIYPIYGKKIRGSNEVTYENGNIGYSCRLGNIILKNNLFNKNSYNDAVNDEARAIYVALTRAKETVIYIENELSFWNEFILEDKYEH